MRNLDVIQNTSNSSLLLWHRLVDTKHGVDAKYAAIRYF